MEDFVVKSKVREFLKKKDFRVSEEFLGALNKEIKELLTKAGERAKSNGRKTLRGFDL